jgi:hypothetical protein
LPVSPAIPREPAPAVAVRRPRPGPLGFVSVVLGIVCLALGIAVFVLGQTLLADGYRMRPHPPFLVKPRPPVQKAPDLAHAAYDPPVLLSAETVDPDLLAWSASDQSILAVSRTGQLLRFDMAGHALSKYPLPGKLAAFEAASQSEAALPALTPGVVSHDLSAGPPTNAANPPHKIHWTVDSEGDIYVSDPLEHVVRKFGPSGKPLALIGSGRLADPQALAVSSDATVFVVDGRRLRVLRARMPAPTARKAAT